MNDPIQMNCSEALGELPLYVGDDLESSARERVARHLNSCEPCRGSLAQIDAARSARMEHFEAVASGEPSSSLWPDLRAQLRAEGLVQIADAEPDATILVPQPAAAQSASTGMGRLLRFLPMTAAAAGLFFLGTLTRQGPTVLLEPGPALDSSPVVVETSGATLQPVSTAGNLKLVPKNAGSMLQPVNSAEEFLIRHAQPFYGETVRPFNALHPSAASYSPASLQSDHTGGRCDGLR